MNEKSAADEFEDDPEPVIEDSSDNDDDLERVDQVFKDLDLAKRRGQKAGDPAWRKLERLLEEKRTAELTSDFADYPIGLEAKDNGHAGHANGKDAAPKKPRAVKRP